MKLVTFLALVLPLVLAAPPAVPAQSSRRTPIVQVVETVSPAVVNIAAESIVRQADPFFGPFFGGRSRRVQSLGSGLIIDSSGIVVTNAHVIDGASRIIVTTRAGQELEADVIGSDRDADLAVLKIEANGLAAVALGSSKELMIGETVVAIGNPFGLTHTVTTGVLSARGRSVPSESGERLFTDFLQTDASINPGNSGGPQADGIGFAIPADRARRVTEDLLRFGSLQPLWTGLRLMTVDPELARRWDLPADRGVVVVKVYPDSPAAQAGFADDDLIVALQGKSVATREDLTTALYSVPEASRLEVEVRRGRETVRLPLWAEYPEEGLGLTFVERALGMIVSGDAGRVVVRRVLSGSPAARKGLRSGDRVLAANGQEVNGVEDLGRETMRAMERGSLFLVVQRGRYAYNISFPL